MIFLNRSEYDLKKLTHIKVGDRADYLYFPEDYVQLSALIRECHENHQSYFPVGGGSNTLFGRVRETVLISDLKLPWKWNREGKELVVSCNHNINYLLIKAGKLGLCGLEFLAGIPAHVGGLTYMNAGAYQKEIFNLINWVKVVDYDGEKILSKEDIRFGYRYTNIKGFITEVSFTMEEDLPDNINRQIKDLISKRKQSQPLESPNIGCFFKNPVNHSAGRLIDEAGLKGYQIGGVRISEKHANFLINVEDASYQDVIKMIDYVQNEIIKKTGISLELEIKVLNEEKES